ncbi:MAG TPA: hypothetical protein VF281_04355 [Candidatus Saccharimonadales bacterium]
MTNHFEHNSASNNSNHILNNLEFTPEPPTIEEQELALLDLQKRFMSEWADDPNGFMIWLIRRADSYIDSTNGLVRLSLGLRHTEGALGVRIKEEVVIHALGRRILPSLTPGNGPKTQYINDYIPLITNSEDGKKHSRYLEPEHVELLEGQVEQLRQLRTFCPNLDDDLMTIIPTPGKELVHVQHSDAYVMLRLQQ